MRLESRRGIFEGRGSAREGTGQRRGQGEQGQNIVSYKFADVTTKGWRLRALADLQSTQVSAPATHIVAHNWL